jgi:phage-related protein
MLSEPRFEIEFLSDAVAFVESLDEKSRDKLLYNLKKSQYTVDHELFKKLTDHIWEFRTLYNGNSYRLFAFWDRTSNQNTLVISTHGLKKKTQKTPQKEIKKAEEIRKQYLENKK